MATHDAVEAIQRHDDTPTLIGGIAALGWACILEWVLILYRAWCLSLMWLWFVVPLGVRELALYQAVGIMFIAVVVRNSRIEISKDSKLPIGGLIFIAFRQPTMALVLSYGVMTLLKSS
jgi:hypothetical protein